MTDDSAGADRWAGDHLAVVVGHPKSNAYLVARLIEDHDEVAFLRRPGAAEIGERAIRQLDAAYANSLTDLGKHESDGSKTTDSLKAISEARGSALLVSERLVEYSRAQGSSSMVVEFSPGLRGRLITFCTEFPDARVIVVLGDPVELAAIAVESSELSWLGSSIEVPLLAALDVWKQSAREAINLIERFPDRVHVVGSSCLDQPSVARNQLVEFLGVRSDGIKPSVVVRSVETAIDPALQAEVVASCSSELEKLAEFGIAWRLPDAERSVEATTAETGTDVSNAEAELRSSSHQTLTRMVPQNRRDLSYRAAWSGIFRATRDHRDLISQLFRRDFLATYRRSLLGLAWLFIAPALALLQWVIVRGNGVIDSDQSGVPYAVWVLMGTTMWGLFMGFYTAAKATLSGSGTLLLQIRFPHETLLFKQVGQQVAMFAAAFVLNIGVMAIYGVVPAWQAVFLPLVMIPLMLFSTAIGLITALVAVVAVDVDRLLTVLLGMALWLTPVVYSIEGKGETLQRIVRWNPLTYLVLSCRDVVLYGNLYDPAGFAIVSAISVILFVVAGRLFYVAEPQLIEKLV